MCELEKRRSIAVAPNGFGDRVDRSSDADSNSEVRNSSSTRMDEQETRAASVFETQRNIRQCVEDRIKTSECNQSVLRVVAGNFMNSFSPSSMKVSNPLSGPEIGDKRYCVTDMTERSTKLKDAT